MNPDLIELLKTLFPGVVAGVTAVVANTRSLRRGLRKVQREVAALTKRVANIEGAESPTTGATTDSATAPSLHAVRPR